MVDEPQSVGVGARLQERLAERNRSIREFVSDLEAAGVANSAYSSVFRYVKGEVAPSLTWIEEAARVLRVRPAWLAFGETPKSPAAMASDLPGPAQGTVLHAREILTLELLRKLLDAQPADSPALSEEDLKVVARAIRTHIDLTLFALTKGGDAGAGSPTTQFPIMALAAMIATVPGPQQGRPIREVLAKLPQRGPRDRLELPAPEEDSDNE